MPKRNSYYILVALTVIGVVARLIPHVPNVTPVTAIALFISAYVGVKYSIPAILGLMFIGDSIIGFYSWPIMLSVYGSLVVSALLGIYLRKNKTVGSVFVSTMSASLVFFLVTNWAAGRTSVWATGPASRQSNAGSSRGARPGGLARASPRSSTARAAPIARSQNSNTG
jgi:hypothetical protein